MGDEFLNQGDRLLRIEELDSTAKRLRYQRQIHDMTRDDVATGTNGKVTYRSLVRWEDERNDSTINSAALIELAKLFGVSVDWLLCRTESENWSADINLNTAAKTTGLSPDAVRVLMELKNNEYMSDAVDLISRILESSWLGGYLVSLHNSRSAIMEMAKKEIDLTDTAAALAAYCELKEESGRIAAWSDDIADDVSYGAFKNLLWRIGNAVKCYELTVETETIERMRDK